MNGRTFVDTNVLVYAHDLDAGKKREAANAVLAELWETRTGVLSMQVLQEFYVNITRKIAAPISKAAARSTVNDYIAWCIETTAAEISAAFQLEDQYRITFWDALIVSSAAKSGATRILSEDLNAGQRYAGMIVENPFVRTVR
jgi:predicted nucleic acid-binding protein